MELGLVEQRYKAVMEVLDGASVTGVAVRNGVVRQTVHDWVRRYDAPMCSVTVESIGNSTFMGASR